MAYSPACFFDVWAWVENLPPITQWRSDSISTPICSSFTSSSSSSYQPSLKLSITRSLHSSSIRLAIFADYSLHVVLWTSNPILITPKVTKGLLNHETIFHLLTNIVQSVLNYGHTRRHTWAPLRLPRLDYYDDCDNIRDIFNISFLTLSFVVCIYECPQDLRATCIHTLKDQFAGPRSRASSLLLMRLLGSDIEEQWMRTVNLAITNWIVELEAMNLQGSIRTPSTLFSYSNSSFGLWKVQLYCPVIAMDVEKSSSPSPDDRLRFSLNYHQLEGVIQLNYRVLVRDNWIEVLVNTDNIRCDVVRLVDESQMKGRGAGACEKHFPSRISLKLTPSPQINILSVSVSRSSENPAREIGTERTVEASFEPPNLGLGLKVGGSETAVASLKPWKFEQSVKGDTACFNWFLHDSGDGREVFSSKPSKLAMMHPKAWFKHRYSNVFRPFTRQGGVIFAGDEYGEKVVWKLEKTSSSPGIMDWELSACIWLTYWPNKHNTFYTDTRMCEFKQLLHLPLSSCI
ncbi:unnamed protein product [Cuscuta epithymum]|uniref:Uncharacterized protein n=1 Tax=Cuscuta epithymum TaxID=186058 RepID=A0AAV0E432_9ASTE|nr:unnamed protein product [Cuscuta epithymum]